MEVWRWCQGSQLALNGPLWSWKSRICSLLESHCTLRACRRLWRREQSHHRWPQDWRKTWHAYNISIGQSKVRLSVWPRLGSHNSRYVPRQHLLLKRRYRRWNHSYFQNEIQSVYKRLWRQSELLVWQRGQMASIRAKRRLIFHGRARAHLYRAKETSWKMGGNMSVSHDRVKCVDRKICLTRWQPDRVQCEGWRRSPRAVDQLQHHFHADRPRI